MIELRDEIINYSAIIVPMLLATIPVVFAGNTPQRRLISVVLPALCGILAVGFGLQGLTRGCFPNEVSCESWQSTREILGNSFGDQKNCRMCAHPLQIGSPAFILNEYRPIAVVVAAITCCQLSLLSIILFVRWMRRIENQRSPTISTFSPNIVLIGFMGSGKTTISKLLGESLDRKVIEMDEVIAQRAGFPSVAKIIDELGEPHFRELESALAQELSQATQLVISTGGGIISRHGAMESFKQAHAKIVFLECSFDRVRERLSAESELKTERPLFRDIRKAKDLFVLREPIYREWADVTIPVETLSPVEVRDSILKSLSLCPR